MSRLDDKDKELVESFKAMNKENDKIVLKLYEKLIKNINENLPKGVSLEKHTLLKDVDKKLLDSVKVLKTGDSSSSKKNKKTKAGNDHLEDQVTKYQDYVNKYLAVAQGFNDTIEKLEDKKSRTLRRRKRDEYTILIEQTKGIASETLSGLDEQMNITSEGVVKFAEGLIGKSRTQLIEALQTAYKSLAEKSPKTTSEGVTETITEQQQAEIDKLKAEILVLIEALKNVGRGDNSTLPIDKNKIKGKTDSTDPASNTDGKKAEAKTGEATKSNQVKMWETTGKLMGDAKKLTGEILDSFSGIDDGTKQIVSSAYTVAETTMSLIAMITGFTNASVGATAITAGTASATIQSLETASVILKIISTALMVAQAMASFITNLVANDKKTDKDIANKQKSVDDLKKKYEKLGEEINNSYGYAASDKIEEQNANLYEQQKLIKEQMALEEDKKKIDKSKMNDYQKQLDENEKKIKANETAAVDAIFGADLESAIDDFATAYLEVWDSAEGKVKAQQDVVKNMIKGIIKELVKEGIADKVKALRERIAEAMKDGGISDAEDAQIQAEANAITAKMDADTKMMDKYLKDDPEREASKRGFGAITQESADELNGRFTSIQYNTDEITKSVRTLALNSDSVLKSLLGIQNNTSHCSRLETIESDMSAVKVGIGIMTTKGVKML